MAKILIVDDQPMILKCLKTALDSDGHDIATVAAGDMALNMLGAIPFDIIITDYAMPRMDGLTFLERANERCPGVPIIMITGYGTADTAMSAMTKGAFDYLTKPFALDDLRSSVIAAEAFIKARRNINAMIEPDPAKIPYINIVAASPAMIDVCGQVQRAAGSDSPVLLHGERGTGKEILARTIHALGSKHDLSIERVNCPDCIEGESVSPFLDSGGIGAVFFREIASMPRGMQDELLSFLQNRSGRTPAGGPLAQSPARVLASSSVPLEPLVEAGGFGAQLASLLTATPITVPPLRARPEDVRVHIGLLLRTLTDQSPDVVPIEPEALVVLERYPWPGNIPELQEVIRSAMTMAQGEIIKPAHLPAEVLRGVGPVQIPQSSAIDPKQFRGRIVKDFLKNAKGEYTELISKIEHFAP